MAKVKKKSTTSAYAAALNGSTKNTNCRSEQDSSQRFGDKCPCNVCVKKNTQKCLGLSCIPYKDYMRGMKRR